MKPKVRTTKKSQFQQKKIFRFLLLRYQDIRTPGNKLVINLALSDIIMHMKSWVLIINGFHGGPMLGGVGKSNGIISH
jgi:hypothetical protein